MTVQSVKVLHTHEIAPPAKKISFGISVKAAFYSCNICDYNFAKDQDHYYFLSTLPLPVSVITSYTFFTSSSIFDYTPESATRGPPSAVSILT